MTGRRLIAAVAAAIMVAAVGGGMVLLGDEPDSAVIAAEPSEDDASTEPSVAPSSDPPSPVSASTTTSPTASESPEPTESESESESETESETETEPPGPSYDVEAVQARLRDLRYYVGAVDGKPGAATTSAVMAFQKVNGLSADGVVGPNTLAALDSPATPDLRSGPATRIEVDLSRQVAYLVKGGSLARIMPVSSGSGGTYTTSGGGTARSLTPVGWYEIERRITGVREAPLGILYDPLYFYRGWAMHGSNSVPAYPASHGCVRLTRSDARWLAAQVANGTAVHLYGGAHTFTAGSSAPGTDVPAGDTEPEPSKDPTQSPSPSPKPKPSPEPTPKPEPSPEPSASQSESASEGSSPDDPSPTPSASAS